MKTIKMFNIYHEETGEYEVKDNITSDTHVILWDGFFGKWVASERMHFHEKTIDMIKEKEAQYATA